MEWGYARSVLTFRFWDSLPTKDRRPNYRPARVGQKDSFLANVWAGATPRTFWAAESQKRGVAPARFGVFSTVTFAFTASLSPTLQRNCARHRVKNLEKTTLKKVILTLFTCSVRILAATPRRNTGDLCLSCTVHLSPTGTRPRKRNSSNTIFALASIRVCRLGSISLPETSACGTP